jgi:disulfide bond formation protein DsbB
MRLSLNVCGLDRTVRIIVGVVLAAVAYFGILTGVLATVAYIVAAIAFLTGIAQICPINRSLGINTCKPKPTT